MANVEQRPYAGTWRLNRRTVVKYTPDALIFVNGDTSLPGCPRCRGRVDIQRYVTSLSVEAGTDPTSHSATVQLSVPRVQGEQIFIDGYNILRPGLEIHVFMRGYFPIRGMFKHLAKPEAGRNIQFNNPTDDDQLDLSKYATYPYYPVFHGLVTQVTYDYADGFYTGSLQCASLLHFWQYVNMTTSGAWMAEGTRPTNDTGRTTLYGHTFNNMHPFSIIYTLYRDVAGSAAGVDFALSEESNLSAVSEVAATGSSEGTQLFTQVARYWEQRFKTRIQTLRMYGTNGQLFNAAQQAWLGSADTRDGERLLPSPTYNDSESQRTETDPLSARLSVAKALGLQGAGVDFIYSPLIQQDDELFNLSILDMFAFNQTISEIGTANQWTSTFTTKMDIAQQVMEVTGYEFYQDVDGDLVFKPPFYNLDVSTNRYYRLEDSDIINISFTEKEPTATYIIVRGAWIEGLKDAVEGEEVVKRGLYIDYKLVAKFGWRPAPTLELPTIIDPKVLFWIGVARLDMLNVDTFSASCTIPIRPELRPGYPVYIPFCDCYYYITQLSHSFAFGGQCTTNLVLTCRRAKWHAPGFLEPADETGSAITKIRLDRPDLPPRPLEVFVNGIPRVVGFPNVVMALDPRKITPSFSVVGVGIDYFDQFDARTSADFLFSMLQRDVSSLNAFEAVGYEVQPDGTQVVANPEDIQRFRLRYGDNPQKVVEFSIDDLIRAFADYRTAVQGVVTAENDVDVQEEKVAQATASANAFDPASGSQNELNRTNARLFRAAGLERLDTLEGELQAELRDFHRDVGEAGSSLSLLVLVFEALQPTANKPIRRKVDGIAGSDVKLSYFESLTHLKGQYLAGTVPGNYRYFSCSHPFPSQQGMPIIEWDDGDREKTVRRRVTRTNAFGRAEQAPGRSAYVGNNAFQALTEQAGTLPGIDIWMDTRFGSKDSRVWQGRTGTRGAAAAANMDMKTQQRLMDILTVANILVQRILGNSAYQQAVRDAQGRFPGPSMYSGYRPTLEPSDSEAFHRMGVAVDIKWANDNFGTIAAQKSGVLTEAYNTLVNAIRSEMLIAYREGLFQGMGFYAVRPNDGKGPPTTFIHIDRRDDEVAKELTEARGGDLAKAHGAWAEPRTRNDGETAFETWKEFKRRDPLGLGLPGPKSVNLAPVPGRITFSTNPDVASPAPTDAPPETPPQTEVIEEGARPVITTRAISTDTNRVVVQFRPTVTIPDGGGNLRTPEAELGVGTCDQGIQVALGPQRTPRVLTTDQIQSISFVRHSAKKFASVVGPSTQTGRLSFNANQLQKQLTEKLLQDVQDLDNTDQTLADLFEGPYDQIAMDLASIPVPTFDQGEPSEEIRIELPPFDDVLTIDADDIPASVQELVAENMGDTDVYQLRAFTLAELSCVPGFTSRGLAKDNGQEGERQAKAAASMYATKITGQIENTFLRAQTSALEPANRDKGTRITQVQAAVNGAVSLAIGLDRVIVMLNDFVVQEIAAKEGKIQKPVHSPVFPVSDEKGYEHYGAYRYGRGLSVERGGTFEFIHSGQDPFKNVTAQTAEEFLRVLTLVRQGKTSGESGLFAAGFRGIKEGAAKAVEFVLEQRQEPLSEDVASLPSQAQTTGDAVVGPGDVVEKVGLSERERNQVEQSVQDLAQVISELGQTSRGQDALHELLVANGDDPDILDQESFLITDTQFARNFVNFAANYGKSPVFKTVAANAAYSLADLTSHLLARAGDACVCRGSYSDVLMAAYARQSFVAVEGIDQAQQKATAFASEQIIKSQPGHGEQQRIYRGQMPTGEQPDAKAFNDAGGGTETVATGAPLPQTPQVPSEMEMEMVSAENPPTTADPDELPDVLEGPAPAPLEEDEVGAGILPDVSPDPIQPAEFDEDGDLVIDGEEE